MALYLRYAVRSDLGLVRNNNEDSVYAGPRLLAIADGMGGHAAGEVASKIVIGALEPLDEDRRIDDLMRMLRDTVVEANHRIADAVKQRKDLEGMGTTLTALRFVGSQVGLVHVGDSRAYLLRNGTLSQITHDDTYVQYLVDSGKLSPDEAKDHPRKSVILRALLGSEVEPDVSIREARAGDRYLLCSDGLSDVVSAETIAETMQIEDPQECADRLVELALRGGGPDNVTVIVADVINAKVGDTIDGVPVVDGAFVDPSAADVPGADSAAERAARMARPPRPQPREPLKHRRTFRWRPWLIGLAALIVVIGALGGFYAWTQTQYFVGRAGENVAIFRGVDTEFGPLKFYNVYKVTDLPVSHLQQNYRSQVSDGITASSKDEAQKIVDNLKKGQLQ
ncbi:MAG: family protein phosphatase, partial [Pseudonocardiales bacterium]|nr:family protein phosphatase [Pseudonocardiales bacterium]